MEKEEKIIELIGVEKVFDGQTAVENLNLYVRKGEFITFLGPSGCGKSTTLRMIAGFEMPTKGKILLGGKDITNLPPYERPINTVFQRYALFPHLNVYDNIAFGLKLKRYRNTYVDKNGKQVVKVEKLSKKVIDAKVSRVLKLVDLEEFEKRDVTTLSGGQQQRIAIARAIVNEPEILLLDEITAALDPEMVREVLEVVLSLARSGSTMVIVTHEMNFARAIANRILFIENGAVVEQSDDPKAFFASPKTDRAKAFLKSFDYDE